MTIWDPERYLAFADHRLRPALELLARIANDTASTVVDLGCGPGNITPYLQARWPQATYTGVDSSQEMLAAASAAHPGATWVDAAADTWVSDQPVDVLCSNAALHWVDDHARIFEHLVARPGVPRGLWQRCGAALLTPAWRRDIAVVQTSFCDSHDELTYFVQIG